MGSGRGDYDRLDKFDYVGDGLGDFEKEETVEIIGYRLRPCCWELLIAAFVGLGIWMYCIVPDSFWPWSRWHWWSTAGEPDSDSDAGHSEEFCTGRTWHDISQRDWCCERRGKFCPFGSSGAEQELREPEDVGTTSSSSTTFPSMKLPMFSCLDHSANPMVGWPDHKKVWCCLHAGIGCTGEYVITVASSTKTMTQTLMPPPAPLSTIQPATIEALPGNGVEIVPWPSTESIPVSASTQGASIDMLPTLDMDDPTSNIDGLYDCADQLSSWATSWPIAKQAWCCGHQGKGCQQAAVSTSFGVYFNCDLGFSSWQALWPVDKKRWCCQNVGKGCMMN